MHIYTYMYLYIYIPQTSSDAKNPVIWGVCLESLFFWIELIKRPKRLKIMFLEGLNVKSAISSVSSTPQPFLFTFPFLNAAPTCFLGGPVLFDTSMFVCMMHAWTIIFDTFWQWGIKGRFLAKSCNPNYPQNARKNPANARKNCQTPANPDFW